MDEDVDELSPSGSALLRNAPGRRALARSHGTKPPGGLLDGSYSTAKRVLEELVAHELLAQAEWVRRGATVPDESAIGPILEPSWILLASDVSLVALSAGSEGPGALQGAPAC